MNAVKLVQESIDMFEMSPPDLLGIGDQLGESIYVNSLKSTYQRTVDDICALYDMNLSSVKIAELGAFLGIVSKALALGGANVTACDIPEFFDRANVQKYYERIGIKTKSFNLRQENLPFPENSLDCVVLCETLEHLNFNPLPVILDINRVLKNGGILYVSVPNGGYLLKRF